MVETPLDDVAALVGEGLRKRSSEYGGFNWSIGERTTLDKITHADGTSTTVTYAPNLITVTAPGQVTTMAQSHGQIVNITSAEGSATFTNTGATYAKITTTDVTTEFSWGESGTINVSGRNSWRSRCTDHGGW